MYNTTIPEDKELREKRRKSLIRTHKFVATVSFVAAVLAVLLLLGVVVLFFVLEFGNASQTLMFSLMGAFFGGTLLFALAAFFLMRASERLEKRRDDFLERCDSESSFFVGEGTLATFAEGELVLHSESRKNKVRVPYGEMRFISVCTRRAPREEGEWSVVLEIPARYLTKNGKGAKNEPPALVQTDMKPRLLRVLEERGLTLLGERLPVEGAPHEILRKKFTAAKTFSLPHAKKRRRAVLLVILGAVLTALGLPLGLLLGNLTLGAVVSVIGLMIAGKSLHSWLAAKAIFAVYAEGIYWGDTERTERVFLKWEEIERLAAEEQEGLPVLAAYTVYGAYRFPRAQGVWEYLAENWPERVEKYA